MKTSEEDPNKLHIIVSGVTHKTAPVEIREKLAFTSCSIKEGLLKLVPRAGEKRQGYPIEGTILSTCNRTEIYVVVEKVDTGLEAVWRFMSDFFELSQEEFGDYLYACVDKEAVSHLFAVASGIDSMVVGETQIQGQVRDAFQSATAQGATGVVLSSLFRQAIRAGKRARTETRISENAVSISSVAVELSKRIFGDLGSRQALLVGAGETSELAAKTLVDNGIKRIFIANRTYQRAVETGERLGGEAIDLKRINHALWVVDIVISSTAAPHIIIEYETIRTAMQMRHNRPLFLVDVAVPRDIDPTVQRIDNVYLYNIDDLQTVVEANIRERHKEVIKVESIIQEEVAQFMAWLGALQVVPTILDLKERAEQIRKSELAKALRRLGSLSEREENIINSLTVGIVNKMLHYPIVCLKKHANDDGRYLYSKISRELLGLVDNEASDSLRREIDYE